MKIAPGKQILGCACPKHKLNFNFLLSPDCVEVILIAQAKILMLDEVKQKV